MTALHRLTFNENRVEAALDLTLSDEFGGSWGEFVRCWCAGHAPAYELEEALLALRTVTELWPHAIPRDRRGLYSACGLIELGRLLVHVRPLPGFNELLHRLKRLDQGAHAELIVAGCLIRAGRVVRLAPECGASVLDLAVRDGEKEIFIEIVSPDLSEQLHLQQRLAAELAFSLNQVAPNADIRVEFNEDVTAQVVEQLVKKIGEETSEDWQEFGAAVRYRRRTPVEANAGLEIQWPGVDHRAGRIVRRKCEQLSRETANVLVIDMSSIAGSTSHWIDAIGRMFQPAMNTRLGAVVIYQSTYSMHLDRGRRLWWVIENPFAIQRIPPQILRTFESFDESGEFQSASVYAETPSSVAAE